MSHVFTKSAKGLRETTGKTRDLPAELREVLISCKGQFNPAQIAAQAPAAERGAVLLAIAELIERGYLRQIFELSSDEPDPLFDAGALSLDLDFSELAAAPVADDSAGKLRSGIAARRSQRDEQSAEQLRRAAEKIRRETEAKAKRDAEEAALREIGEQARLQAEEEERRAATEQERLVAEEAARQEAEAKARVEVAETARREAEAQARREATEQARREAEAQARREAEEQARLDAEEQARRKAEETARREAEAQARREAEEQARLDAEEKARRKAEEKARREADEKARRKAEEQARREAAELARLEAEEREREAVRERLRLRKERKKKLLLPPLSLFVLLLPVLALYSVQFISFERLRLAFVTQATEQLGTGVTAREAHLELIPSARMTVSGVVVGEDSAAIRIERMTLGVPWSTLWKLPKEFETLHVEGAHLPLSVLLKALHSTGGALPVKSGMVTARGVVVTLENGALPPLDGEVRFVDARLASLVGQGEGEEFGKLRVEARRQDGVWHTNASAEHLTVPFGVNRTVTDATLTGQLSPGGLAISEFKAYRHDGRIEASGTLTWQAGWKMAGKLELKRLDAAKLAPGWFQDGYVNGQGEISASAAEAAGLYALARIDGRFSIAPGVLGRIDLDRAIEGQSLGERYRFDTLQGRVRIDGGRAEFSDLKLAVTGGRVGGGTLSLTADGAARGQFTVEVRTARARLAATVAIGGTLDTPQFRR